MNSDHNENNNDFYHNFTDNTTSNNEDFSYLYSKPIEEEVKEVEQKENKLIKSFKNQKKIFKILSVLGMLIVISTITVIVLAELKLIKLPWLDYPEVLTLSQNEITIKKDGTFQFSSYVYPSQVNYGKVIYESSDPTVADINPITGYVEAKKNGVATIKAYLEDYHDILDTCELVVSNTNVLVESLSITHENIDLLTGNTYMLKYEYYPKNAGLHYFSYSSSDNSIINVNNRGEVTALKPGKAVVNILEEVSGQSIQQEFTVYKKNANNDEKFVVSSIKLSTDKLSLNIGGEYQATATVYPEDIVQNITWSSLDNSVATVSDNGLITAIDYGTTQIIATAVDGTNKIIEVTIQEERIPIENIKVAETITLNQGDNKKIGITIEPKNATNQRVLYESDDSSIASVRPNGVVTGLVAGETMINVSTPDGKFVAKTRIVVKKVNNAVGVTNIKLSKADVTLKAGSSTNISATIVPSNATIKKVIWTSEDTRVATVSDGMIYGKAPGKTYIIVSAGNVSKRIMVVVNEIQINSISLNQSSAKLGRGGEVKLYATFSPSNATNKVITWTSSNNSIASVNSSGLVTGHTKGQAVIIATASNGKTAKCVINVTNDSIQVTSLKLSSKQYLVKVNNKVGITPIITPNNATNQKITLTSNNPAIAEVQSDGTIKGIKEGVVQITAKTNNGKTASAFVVVKNKNASVNYLDGTTIKYWYDNTYGNYAITHIWVKNAYSQFKTEIPDKFGSLANPNTLTQKAAKKNNGKTLISINASGFVTESFTSELYKVNKSWKNTSVSPIVIYEGKLLRDYTSYDLPIEYIRIYGMNKNGNLDYYTYDKDKSKNTGRANRMLSDGIKYTFGWFPVLVKNSSPASSSLSKSTNIRQSICQIDKHNFLYITNITNNRAKGFSPYSLANKMVELGCKTGFNLDGGGSTSIYYVKKGSSTPTKIKVLEGNYGRSISDILYFVGD